MNNKLILILDSVGRTILGNLVNETEVLLEIKNPVILDVAKDDEGRLSVQLLPVLFREFLADKEEGVTFSYRKDRVTQSNIENLDFRLSSQYNNLFSNNSQFVSPEPVSSNEQESKGVINLFDE